MPQSRDKNVGNPMYPPTSFTRYQLEARLISTPTYALLSPLDDFAGDPQMVYHFIQRYLNMCKVIFF